MQSDQTTPPKRIWADPPETFDGMDIWRSEPGGRGVEYILASEHAALIREAEARGMERAMPSDQAIQDLADHIWRVHPNEIAEAGYAHVSHGGKYENPRAAWYADQIKALCRAAAIRAAKATP